MIERIAALGADYVGTLGAFALTEAAEDAARLRAAARATLFAGFVMAGGARRARSALHPMSATRRVLLAEIGGRDPAVSHPPPAPMGADEASARLRAIRIELRETVALDRGPDGAATDEPVPSRFEPRSRTMRTVMWVWRAIPRVPAATAFTGALGLVAVSSPRLRRLLALVALLRNLGGHPRPLPHGGPAAARSQR